jgi:hypothetical protein
MARDAPRSASTAASALSPGLLELVSDVTKMGEYSPEVIEAEWIDGATGPVVGARYRGHVKRNEEWCVYWTTCKITECVPGHVFEFAETEYPCEGFMPCSSGSAVQCRRVCTSWECLPR